MENNNYKPIHAWLWSPSSKSFIRFPKNDPATIEVYYCEKSDTCPFLKNKQCINNRIFGPKCPHGYIEKEEGPTIRSVKLNKWVKEKEDKFKHIFGMVKGSPPDKIAVVGDWIYLPYSHADLNKGVPFQRHNLYLVSGRPFIKKELFTLDVIKSIVDFRPQSLMSGEITDYQTKIIPKFLFDLEEVFPQFYDELMSKNLNYVEKYNLKSKNYIGRKALLKTIAPCEIITDKNVWDWNGKELKNKTFDTLWIGIDDVNGEKAIDKIDVIITPSDKAVVVITNNNQVLLPTTIFVD